MNERQVTVIRSILDNYTLLQKCYMEWASNFSRHEDVIRYLKGEKIRAIGIKKQSTFNLHSSHWNGITIPIIKKLASRNIVKLKQQFDCLFDIKHDEDWRMIWYWLFFIHPVRHELYYFDDHYPLGYQARLSKLLRSHRSGLKAAKTRLGGKRIINSEDSFIKGCGTVAFKHLLLHPTTARWQFSEADLPTLIQKLDIVHGDLSHDEMITANLLSKRGSLQFNQWLSYAPCAINEGPIFTMKAGLNLLESFDITTKILSANNISQLKLRQSLQAFFNIEELTNM
ncbi:MAG: hypothetical protein V1769_05555 [Thermoplasmatota archaeon]